MKTRWQDWSGDAVENLTLRETQEGIFVRSIISSKQKVPFTVKYTIVCDSSWRVRNFNIELVEPKKVFELESDGFGRWSDNSGIITRLNGAIDIDITATPFTNTLPIRRLKLGKKQSQEFLAVYIKVPELDVSTNRQRYTCLIPNKRYRFESIDSNFIRDIEVDEHGLVLIYPGLFKRM